MLNDQSYPPLLGNMHENLFVSGEIPADFYALLKSLVEGFHPASTHEQALVEQAAVDRWYLWRRQRSVHAREAYLYAQAPEPLSRLPNEQRELFLAQRLQHSAERSWRRSFSTLEAIRKENLRTERWDLTFDLQKQRLALAQRKYEDTALKVKTQAKLAALQADQDIAAEIQQLKQTACQGQKRPSIIQNVKVSVFNGVTKTVKTPSNQDILDELAARALYLFPPEQVVREFSFEHAIPSEYEWAVEENQYRGPATSTVFIPLDEFSLVAAVETEHCLGDFPDIK